MKKIIVLIAICLSVSVPALAQECTPEAKTALYNEFRQNFKGDTAKANALAKKWLACPEVAGEEQISAYLKNFVTLFEKADRKNQVIDLVYNKKDYPKAFEIGKAVLTDEPDNLKVIIDLAYAGFAAATAKNESFTADAVNYAKRAMQLIESGKAPEKWEPYLGKDDALAYLNNIIGLLTVQRNPTEALPFLLKVAQYDSKLKPLPSTYATIAAAYEAGPYAKLSEQYKATYGGKDETPESKLALENINQVIDRMIDAYARAVALATDPAQQAAKKEWMESLSTWYKYRHNQSDVGLNEVIAGILSKPLPPLPTPITTLPTAAPASTPTSGAVSASGSPASNGSASSATSTSSQPATTMTNSGSAATAPKTTPATTTKPKTTAPAKPRMKRHHP
jgi:hypothetical protein